MVLVLLVLAGGGAGWWWQSTDPRRRSSGKAMPRPIIVKVGPTQQGLLTTLAVRRGSKVAAGAPLFEQDDTADRRRPRAGDAAAPAGRGAARQSPGRRQADRDPAGGSQSRGCPGRARQDPVRSQAQRGAGEDRTPSPVQLVDQQRADLRSAMPRCRASRRRSRRCARRWAASARSRRSRRRSRRRAPRSTWRSGGSTSATSRRRSPASSPTCSPAPARRSPPAAPVVSLLPPENIFVRFFVPEPRLAEVHIGDQVGLVCDNCPADLAATISFISPQAEYTPPVIYSESIRAKLVYMVEARPAAGAGRADQSRPARRGAARRRHAERRRRGGRAVGR